MRCKLEYWNVKQQINERELLANDINTFQNQLLGFIDDLLLSDYPHSYIDCEFYGIDDPDFAAWLGLQDKILLRSKEFPQAYWQALARRNARLAEQTRYNLQNFPLDTSTQSLCLVDANQAETPSFLPTTAIQYRRFPCVLNTHGDLAQRLLAYMGQAARDELWGYLEQLGQECLDVFFKDEQNIAILAQAQAKHILNKCLSWNETFRQHFIHGHRLAQDYDFAEAVLQTDVLWQRIIQHALAIKAPQAVQIMPWSERLQAMHELLDNTDTAHWPLQIQEMFELDWSQKELILKQNLPVVTQASLNDALEAHALAHIPNLNIQSFAYFKKIKFKMLEAQKTDMLKFLCCLIDGAENKGIENLVKLYCEAYGSLDEDYLEELKQLQPNQLMSAQCLFNMSVLIKPQAYSAMIRQYKTYLDHAFSYARGQKEWHYFFERYPFAEQVNKSQQFMNLDFNDSGSSNFFKLINLLIVPETTPDDRTELITSFNKLAMDKQEQLLEILLSIEHGYSVDINSMLVILTEGLSQPLDQVFRQCALSSKFKYFNRAADFDQDLVTACAEILSPLIRALDKLTNDACTIPKTGYSFASCLKPELKMRLLEKKHEISELLDFIYDEHANGPLDLNKIFDKFSDLQTFFADLMNMTYQQSFKTEIYAIVVVLTFNNNGTIRDLLASLSNKFDMVSLYIGDVFRPEALAMFRRAGQAENIFDLFLNEFWAKNIKTKINHSFNALFDTSLSADWQQMEMFMADLQCQAKSFTAFAMRVKSISNLIHVWPEWMKRFEQLHIDASEIWSLGMRYLLKDGPAPDSYWYCFLDCLELVTTHHSHDVSMAYILELFLKQRHMFPMQDLDDPSWNSLQLQLHQILQNKAYLNHPAFPSIISMCFNQHLKHKQALALEPVILFFDRVGEQNQAILPSLLCLLKSDNPELKSEAERLFQAMTNLLQGPDRIVWTKLLKRFLQQVTEDLEDKIGLLNQLILRLQQVKLNYLDILEQDIDWNLQSLSEFLNTYEHMHASWRSGIEFTIQVKGQVKTSLFSSVFEALTEFIFPEPEAAAPFEYASEVHQALDIFKQTPYPSLAQLTTWLKQDVADAMPAIRAFDCDPIPSARQAEKPIYAEEDFKRWFSDLAFYDKPLNKQHLEQRLLRVLDYIDDYECSSRQDLLGRFEDLVYDLSKTQDQEDQLLAIIAVIYHKVCFLRPYPVQLLFVLLQLESRGENAIIELDTGEGKSLSIALLAAFKWTRRINNHVLILSPYTDLIQQDFLQKRHYDFYHFLGIPVDPQRSIILKDSDLSIFNNSGGIFYATAMDWTVFSSRLSLEQSYPYEVIVDEVDKILLDQLFAVYWMEEDADYADLNWIYPYLNRFIDEYLAKTDLIYHQTQWAETCRDFIIKAGADDARARSRLYGIDLSQYTAWIRVALYAKTLEEHKDFVVMKALNKDAEVYQAIPYVQQELYPGYEWSYAGMGGVQACLHARLSSPTRTFSPVTACRLKAILPSLDLNQAVSFVGLSGSIGAVPDLMALKKLTGANLRRMGRHRTKQLQELPMRLFPTAAKLNDFIFKQFAHQTHPVLLGYSNMTDAESAYRQLSKLDKTLRLMTDTVHPEILANWLHADLNEQHAGSPNAWTFASKKTCGRGADIVAAHAQGLLSIPVNILLPRDLIQFLGRTARNGQIGQGMELYSCDVLKCLARDYQVQHLPHLNEKNLGIWISRLTKAILEQQHHSRTILGMRSFVWQHVQIYFKDKNLSQADWYHLQQLMMHAWHVTASTLDLNVYIDAGISVVQKFEARLGLQGRNITSSTVFSDSIHTAKIKGCMVFQAARSQEHFRNITHHAHAIHLPKYLKNIADAFPQHAWFWAWINPKASTLARRIEKAWEDYKQNPSHAHWQEFYQNLCMAEELYQQHTAWFYPVGILKPWVSFLSVIDLNEPNLDLNTQPPSLSSWWAWLWQLFFPVQMKLHQDLRQAFQRYHENPQSEEYLDDLSQLTYKMKYQQAYAKHDWFFWQSWFRLWEAILPRAATLEFNHAEEKEFSKERFNYFLCYNNNHFLDQNNRPQLNFEAKKKEIKHRFAPEIEVLLNSMQLSSFDELVLKLLDPGSNFDAYSASMQYVIAELLTLRSDRDLMGYYRS